MPIPPTTGRDFLAVLLKPLVEALTLPPVVPETGMGLSAVKFYLHSAEFEFQHWVVTEILMSISNVINSPVGESSGWDRQMLISKLAPLCILPSSWKDIHDTWTMSKGTTKPSVEATPKRTWPSTDRSTPPIRKVSKQSPSSIVSKPSVLVTTPVKSTAINSKTTTTPSISSPLSLSTPQIPGAGEPRLCIDQIKYSADLVSSKCIRGTECAFSHTKAPTKDQLTLLFKVLKDDAAAKAIKQKFRFDSM